MKKLSLLATILAVIFAATARAEQYGDLIISAKTFLPPTSTYYHGYCEITFHISNTSSKNAHNVKVSFPPGLNSNITASRALRVEPRTTVNCVIYLPTFSYYDERAEIEIDGRLQENMLSVSAPSAGYTSYYSSSPKTLYILRSRNVASAVADNLEATKSSISGDLKVWRSESDAQNWSENYLAYTPCDAVIIDAKDFAAMKPGTKEALKQYVSAGGMLAIGGMETLPEEFKLIPSPNDTENCTSYGFGKFYIFPTQTHFANRGNFLHYLRDQQNLQNCESLEYMVKSFPIVDMNRLPVKGMLIMLIIFSILIGPVLMIILSKYRKRIWMFWLVPLISLAACLGLFIFSVISEGFTPTVKSSTLTILDENSNRATTIGLYGIYAPLTPGDGLNFATTAELRDITVKDFNQKKSLVWSKDQCFENGWVAARIPAYFNIRKCQTRRERVNVKYRGDVPVAIVNGLGADIKNLRYCDKAGNIYTTGPVAAGQEATLTKAGSAGSKIRLSVTDELRKSYAAKCWNISPSAAEPPFPDTYRAELASDPFISTGVSKAILKQNCIVIGICRRTGNAD